MKKIIKKPAAAEKACGGNCTCSKHCGVGKILLKVVIILLVFGAGFCAGKHMDGKRHAPKPVVVAFDDNGCLKMESVKCPKNAEMLVASDANADSCVTIEELGSMKDSFAKTPCSKGCKDGNCPKCKEGNCPKKDMK